MIALFPGQGAQHVGMGKGLYENFKTVKERFEEASDAIRKDLKKLCFDGPESDLTLTENTQPALVLCSVAAYQVAVEETGFRPTVAAGHSLGEYSALVAIGAIPFSTAIRWVHERGKAMQQAVPANEGGMLAVLGLEENAIQSLCSDATALARQARAANENSLSVDALVEPANFNAPGQIVVAGSKDALEQVSLLASGSIGDPSASYRQAKSVKVLPLPVSAPFHCRLMAPARDRMAEVFSHAKAAEHPKAFLCPYVPNRTARPSSEASLVFELLVEQIDHPVLWSQSMMGLLERAKSDPSFSTAVEFGPGKVLQGLLKRIAKQTGANPSSLSCGEPEHLKDLEKEAAK